MKKRSIYFGRFLYQMYNDFFKMKVESVIYFLNKNNQSLKNSVRKSILTKLVNLDLKTIFQITVFSP